MFTNKKSLLALSVASAFALTGCFSDDDNNEPVPDGGDGGDGGVVIVAPETPVALSFVVSGSVVQSNDDDEFDIIGDATVQFLESGVASTNIVDVEGNQVQTLEVGDEGSFLVTRKSGSTTSSVTAIVSAPGFITKAFNIDLSNEDDNDVLVAQFLLTPEDEEGLAADAEVSPAISGSTTTADIVADATPEGGSSLASATLPTGISLQNANGDAVTGSEVTLNVLGTDPSSDTKSLVLPEGLNSDDTSDNVAVPVSLANISLTVDGNKVKKFAGDTLKVTLAAPADLAAGEELTVSSLDEDTGVWMPETFPVTKGTGTVSFDTDHLTWFSVNKKVPVCTDGLTVNFTGDAVPAGGLSLIAYSSDAVLWARVATGSTSRVVPAGFLKRHGVSSTATATVIMLDRDGAIWGETDGEVPVCGTVDDFALTAPYTVVNKTLTITGSCANDSEVAVNVSNSAVRYKRDGKAVRTALKDADGNFQLTNLREGENYTVTVNFRGLPLEGSNTITLNDVNGDDLTQNFEFTCPEVTGSGGSGGSGGTGG